MFEVKYKPRVAIDARPLSYGLTGNSRYLIEVLEFLVHEKSHFEFYLYSNKKIHPMFEKFIQEKKLKVSIHNVIGFFWLNFVLPFLIKKDRIDILWGTLQLLPISKISIPMAVNYHDLNFISAPDTMTTSNYFQHKFFSPMTIGKADIIFCLSENTKREISEFKPDALKKLKLVYPGVKKVEFAKIPLAINSPFIFTVGTLEPRKNLDTLVKAYLLLKKDHPEFPLKLVLASRLGWGQEELTNQLKSGQFEKEGIVFFENPEDNTLHTLYQDCSFFAFPSKHEGFGLPLQEALVEQKICIASDIPIFKEILEEDSDILVKPLDVEGWKTALLQLGQRNSFARRRVWDENKWSWRKTASLIEDSLLLLWHKKLATVSNAI